MALVVYDRVQETSITSGTGTITLAGAVAGYQSFAIVGNGNTTFYTIVDGTNWEVGIGTYTSSSTTLSRDTVLSNSLGTTSFLTLSSNSKQVFCTYPAEKSVYKDSLGNVSPLGTISSGTWQGATVDLSYGGTSASTASGARTNLGLGTIATQDANNVSITGGSVNNTSQSKTTISDYETFTGVSAPSYAEGELWYDSAAHALAYYNDSPNSTVHIGQDLQVKVINNTGSSIANGSPVYITGTSSGQTYPNIALAQANSAATASVIGLTNGAIANGAIGYVTAQGGIDNVNTGTFTVGQVLYLSPYSAGQLMNTIPPTGITVQVGVVSYVNSSTGKIYVKQTTPLAVPASIITGQVALANGGTSANLTAVNGGAVYSTGSALAITAAGTSGQVLTSSGAGAPTWTTPTTGTVTSVTGTSPIASSGGTTPAISISQATTSTNGYLSSTDWNTFNGKQPAGSYLTSVTADSPLTGSGTSASHLSIPAATGSINGYLTSTDWTTFNNKGSGSVTSVSALTLGTTGTDLSSTVANSTTTPVITLNVPTASATNRGALSSADWTTFNNKAPSVTYTTNYIPFGQGTTTLNQSSALQFNGTNLTTTGTVTSTGEITPSVTASSTDLTLSAISTGNINLNTPNGTALKVLSVGATSSNWLQVGNPSTTVIRLGPAGTTVADFRILAPTFTNFYTGSSADGLNDGANQMRVAHTASAVNRIEVTGGATTVAPVMSVQGSDGNIALSFVSKGNARHNFFNNGTTTSRQFTVGTSGITSAVNFLNVDGSATGNALPMQANGTDGNISMAFQPKGTGAIDLAAGSSGVNISNGGTVTAITRTSTGASYTSFPSVAVSAPTTAGNVTAIVSITNMQAQNATIQVGGTGYTVGDTLTVVGGTPQTIAATYTVATVSSGVVTSVNALNFAIYTALPTNPVSTTGGTGTGCTLNLTYGITTTGFNISNAGSGYIEQPSVTFSGGGGSGAAAYATVGSTPKITSLAGTGEVWTSSGRQVIFGQSATTPTTAWTIYNDSFSRSLIQGTGTSGISSGGANNLSFFTNATAQEQLRVSHTASAVNYVQVTGGATGNPSTVTMSGQGSDANINIALTPKGTGSVVANAPIKAQGYTVATLPTAGTIGRIAYVTDALAPTYLGVLTGGGAVKTPVFDNGTAWVSF